VKGVMKRRGMKRRGVKRRGVKRRGVKSKGDCYAVHSELGHATLRVRQERKWIGSWLGRAVSRAVVCGSWLMAGPSCVARASDVLSKLTCGRTRTRRSRLGELASAAHSVTSRVCMCCGGG
jgi:hypothetical protein